MSNAVDWSVTPSPYDSVIAQAEQANGIPPGLLRRQLIQESNLQAEAKNGNATGIAQLEPETATLLNVDPTDPIASIKAAAQFDAMNYKRFGSWSKSLASYEMGPQAVADGKATAGSAGEQYVQDVLKHPDYKGPSANSGNEDPLGGMLGHVAGGGVPESLPGPQGTNGQEDPLSSVLANTAATTPAASKGVMTPAQIEAADEASAKANYDQEDFPTRVGISTGDALLRAKRGIQGIGADIGVGVGNLLGSQSLTQASQEERNALAQEQTANAPYEQAEHGLSNWVGQAAPYAVAPAEAAAGGANLLTRGLAAARAGAAAGGAAGVVNAVPAANAQGQAPSLQQEAIQRAEGGAEGAAAGSILGPVAEAAGTGAGNLLSAAGNKITNALGGSQRTAAGNVANMLKPNATVDTSAASTIPGYEPSLAEAAGSPQVAALDKAMQTKFTDYKQAADAQKASNDDAIMSALDQIRGTRGSGSSLEALYAAREAATSPLYAQAAATASQAGSRVNALPVYDAVTSAIQANRGHTAVTNALEKYLQPNSLFDRVTPDGKGVLASDPSLLANVRQQISTDLNKQFVTDSTGNDMKAAAPYLIQIRNVLDQQLSQANPALQAAREKFAELSQPINVQEYLQSKMPPERVKAPTSTQLTNVLTNIAQDQGRSGANEAKSISPQQISQIEAIRDIVLNREQTASLKPGKDVVDQANDIANSTADQSGWSNLLSAEGMRQAGQTVGGMAGRFLGPGIGGAAVGQAAGGVAGTALGRMLGNASDRAGPAVRQEMQNLLLSPRTNPMPNVAPSQYSRSQAGQNATRRLVNALTGERSQQESNP